MILFKKEEVERLEKLEIRSYNDTSFKYEFELANKERLINEIKSVTFISIFEYEDINKLQFEESGKLINYQEHFKVLISKEQNKEELKNIKKISFIFLVLIFIVAISIIAILLYLNREREIREEEDDILLSEFIIIRDNKLKIRAAKIGKILYNNNNIKYIGPFKDYKAEGKGKYYSKKYKNLIIYDGNFEKGLPHGNGTMNYYEEKRK